MPVKTEDFAEDENGLYTLIKITYTPKYPEEIPILEIEDCVNIDEYDLREDLTTHLTEQVIAIGRIDRMMLHIKLPKAKVFMAS